MSRREKRPGRNASIALVLAAVSCGMVVAAFAAVPLYRLFCQVTGYGGTTQVAEQAPAEIGERSFVVRFDANVNLQLPWMFRPEQQAVKVRVGEPALIYYFAKNRANYVTTGQATFNVTPAKAGLYFNKVACFCFNSQTLQPGQQVDMGVSFFIDPAIVDDPNLDDVHTITLSYTFFADPDAKPSENSDAGTRQPNGAAAR